MKILLIIVSIFVLICLGLLIYLLVSPVRIILNSTTGKYWLGWNSWIAAEISEEHNDWGVRFRLPLWSKWIAFSTFLSTKKKRPKKSEKKSKFTIAKAKKLFGAIHIDELYLLVDTQDVIWNAYLFPFFECIRRTTTCKAKINFQGKNEIKLLASGRIFHFLKAGI